MSTIWGFEHIENKHTLCRGKDCLRQQENKILISKRTRNNSIIDFEKKKVLPLPRKELEPNEDVKVCCICRIRFFKKLFRDKNHRKVTDHCHCPGKYRDAAHGICNLKFNVPNKILVDFHNSSNLWLSFYH